MGCIGRFILSSGFSIIMTTGLLVGICHGSRVASVLQIQK